MPPEAPTLGSSSVTRAIRDGVNAPSHLRPDPRMTAYG